MITQAIGHISVWHFWLWHTALLDFQEKKKEEIKEWNESIAMKAYPPWLFNHEIKSFD